MISTIRRTYLAKYIDLNDPDQIKTVMAKIFVTYDIERDWSEFCGNTKWQKLQLVNMKVLHEN